MRSEGLGGGRGGKLSQKVEQQTKIKKEGIWEGGPKTQIVPLNQWGTEGETKGNQGAAAKFGQTT